MFSKATSFNQPLDLWVSSITAPLSIVHLTLLTSFSNCRNYVHMQDMSSAISLNAMFSQAESFNQDLSSWNLTSAKQMVSVLSTCLLALISSHTIHRIISRIFYLHLPGHSIKVYALGRNTLRKTIRPGHGWFVIPHALTEEIPILRVPMPAPSAKVAITSPVTKILVENALVSPLEANSEKL